MKVMYANTRMNDEIILNSHAFGPAVTNAWDNPYRNTLGTNEEKGTVVGISGNGSILRVRTDNGEMRRIQQPDHFNFSKGTFKKVLNRVQEEATTYRGGADSDDPTFDDPTFGECGDDFDKCKQRERERGAALRKVPESDSESHSDSEGDARTPTFDFSTPTFDDSDGVMRTTPDTLQAAGGNTMNILREVTGAFATDNLQLEEQMTKMSDLFGKHVSDLNKYILALSNHLGVDKEDVNLPPLSTNPDLNPPSRGIYPRSRSFSSVFVETRDKMRASSKNREKTSRNAPSHPKSNSKYSDSY